MCVGMLVKIFLIQLIKPWSLLQVTPFMLVDVGTYVLIGIGGVLLILSAALHCFCKPSQSWSKIWCPVINVSILIHCYNIHSCALGTYACILACFGWFTIHHVGADNGSQFSRRGESGAVEIRMPVWFFLLLPLASSANHHQDDGHQSDPDRHHLTAAKVRILMPMTSYNDAICAQKVRRPLHTGQMERVGRMTDKVREV